MGGCMSSSGPSVPSIVFNMKATSESKSYVSFSKTLTKADKILQTLNDYTGCEEFIKEVYHFV